MKSIIRNIIIIAVVLILGVIGYKMFFSSTTSTSTTGLQTTAGVGAGTSAAPQIAATTPTSTADAGTIGTDFLNTLLSIESISLDDSLFTSKQFTVLQDFNRPIPPDQNPGRLNPFAPIGSDGVTTSVQVSTSSPSSVTGTSATLNGTLLAGDATTTRWFEYGTTSSLGFMTTPKPQTTQGAFTEVVSKLLPNTTYYVRADALIGGATVLGNVLTWKTAQK